MWKWGQISSSWAPKSLQTPTVAKKAMTNVDSVLKCRHSTLPTKVHYQLSSVAQLCLTLCDSMDCSMPGLPVHHQLLELAQITSIQSVMPSNHLILCCPLLPPSVFPSIRAFSKESVLCIKWPKYWSFSFSISLSN